MYELEVLSVRQAPCPKSSKVDLFRLLFYLSKVYYIQSKLKLKDLDLRVFLEKSENGYY